MIFIFCYRFVIIVLLKVLYIIINIDFWLNVLIMFGIFCIYGNIYGWSNCLRINGINSNKVIWSIDEVGLKLCFDCFKMKKVIIIGVINILIKFENEVLYIVLVILFCVIEVNVIEDCIVDGKKYINKKF